MTHSNGYIISHCKDYILFKSLLLVDIFFISNLFLNILIHTSLYRCEYICRINSYKWDSWVKSYMYFNLNIFYFDRYCLLKICLPSHILNSIWKCPFFDKVLPNFLISANVTSCKSYLIVGLNVKFYYERHWVSFHI